MMRGIILLLFSTVMMSFAWANESIHEYHLKNGLTLLVKEDHRAPVVFSSVWYKVGGSYEHNGITGISHVLEHMMFRGSAHFPAGALEKIISENGGEQNAMTDNDQTVYYEQLSADKLSISFQIEADRMHHLLLREDDFNKEIQVVMEERRMRFDDNPTALAYERFMAAAFVNNPYHHQTIGWMTDLKNMTIQDVRRWYKAWYAPNNAILLVVGDVNPAAVYALAGKYFADIPAATLPLIKPRTEITALGEKQVIVNIPAKVPVIFMGYQVPTLLQAEADWQPYALDVLAALLGGTNSSRFAQQLMRGSQIASFAQASYEPYQLHSGLFTLIGAPAQGHQLKELQQAFFQQITALQNAPVSLDELERVKAQVIAENVFQNDSLTSQAMKLGTPVSIGLPWKLSEDYVSKVKTITPEQIQQVAKTFLIPDRLTILTLNPTGKQAKTMPTSSSDITSKGLH